MACVKPDGSLTRIGRAVLSALGELGSEEAVSQALGLPLYRVRLVARALGDKGLVERGDRGFRVTALGADKLRQTA
ncbi:hypothetical protein [Fundidesulfovibrio terrae]|uniref:hypothetical protein n=1 Tax=Fundidesulfovibrio terrae TaxID=2922866 RepID=UPI001FAF9038|nr:hypothetical protein [Fundidesulfovibrio terrae]